MRTLIAFALVAVLAACTSHKETVFQEYETFENAGCPYAQPLTVKIKTKTTACATVKSSSCAVMDPCSCRRPAPKREVLRPRVKEVVVEKPRRDCPPDNQQINCGYGNCPTFRQPVIYQQINASNAQQMPEVYNNDSGFTVETAAVRETIPSMPDAYVLASNRAFNRFIKDTYKYYSQSPRTGLYVKSAAAQSADLPGGVEKGVENFKSQVKKSYAFELANSLNSADYYLETSVDWLDTPSKTVPAVQYTTVLYDKNNNKLNEWVEVIKKANNSQSWL